jgi:hypothetical protein
MGGLAMAATGVAVAAGVVHSPSTALDLADAGTPSTVPHGQGAAGVAAHRSPVVSRSADRTRPADRRSALDPTKKAALGLSSGPAVSGKETVTVQQSAGDPQAVAQALLPSYGWSSSQMSCLVPLWMGESGWRVNAENASSGAYGIPQALPGSKMASAGADWQTDAATQIKWGLGYIQERYGSPCGAWGFKQSHGWY